ncbi:MAG: PQQ-binding-like beta-propeller repeat protein [Planctomycetota bacterium]|nr:PQQ-binding-like beta-propeller repeat protein [Planctomycetota bacterium]
MNNPLAHSMVKMPALRIRKLGLPNPIGQTARSILLVGFISCGLANGVFALDRGAIQKNAIETLRRTLETQERWIKVHAAEALLTVGQPEGVRAVFLAELQKHSNVPEYRIGIWRVLAKCSDDPVEKTQWIGKIQAAMLDGKGHAAETLGKLAVPFPEESRNVAIQVVEQAQGQFALLGVWALAADPQNPHRADYKGRLIDYLSDPVPTQRSLAAYALRFLGPLPESTWRQLVEAAWKEPADTGAQVSMLSASLCTAPDQIEATTLLKVREMLLKASTSPSGPDRYEMCEALSLRGIPVDVLMLSRLIEGSDPIRTLPDVPGPVTDAAIHDHPLNVDVRVAASKAALLIRKREAKIEHKGAGNVGRTIELELSKVKASDWPWWRGYDRTGVAPSGQTPPREWDAEKNVRWSALVPGRGYGSPIVVDDQVLLATADETNELQSVLCFDRGTGQLAWKTDVHRGGLTKKGNKKSTHASCSVACDGDRFFINFVNKDAVYTTALDRQGKQVWQTKVCDYVTYQGYGASPAVYGQLVIVAADHEEGGVVAGLNRISGAMVWKIARPKLPNYTSPIILEAAGKQQLVLTGCDLVTSLDPVTGAKLWEIAGATTECVTTAVTDGTHIFSTGGYPRNHLAAIRADGSGKVAWNEELRVYVPSLIVHGTHVYGVVDSGVAMCWKCDTGETVWRGRLGGTFTSSPVLVDDTIFATNEEGTTYLFRAAPTEFTLLGKNQLGDESFATPAICGSQIFTRVVNQTGDARQEVLYCLGLPD